MVAERQKSGTRGQRLQGSPEGSVVDEGGEGGEWAQQRETKLAVTLRNCWKAVWALGIRWWAARLWARSLCGGLMVVSSPFDVPSSHSCFRPPPLLASVLPWLRFLFIVCEVGHKTGPKRLGSAIANGGAWLAGWGWLAWSAAISCVSLHCRTTTLEAPQRTTPKGKASMASRGATERAGAIGNTDGVLLAQLPPPLFTYYQAQERRSGTKKKDGARVSKGQVHREGHCTCR